MIVLFMANFNPIRALQNRTNSTVNKCIFSAFCCRKDRGYFKRECQKIKYIDQNKKVKTTILKQLMLSDNITLTSSNNDVLQKNLAKTFKTDKDAISKYITECLQYKFSRNTQKVLKRFATVHKQNSFYGDWRCAYGQSVSKQIGLNHSTTLL